MIEISHEEGPQENAVPQENGTVQVHYAVDDCITPASAGFPLEVRISTVHCTLYDSITCGYISSFLFINQHFNIIEHVGVAFEQRFSTQRTKATPEDRNDTQSHLSTTAQTMPCPGLPDAE